MCKIILFNNLIYYYKFSMYKSYYCLVDLHNTQDCRYHCIFINVIVTVIVGEQGMAQW